MNKKFSEITNEEKYQVRLKIAVKKYVVKEDYVEVDLNGNTIEISDKDKEEYNANGFSEWEPINELFAGYVKKSERFFDALKNFYQKEGINGLKIKDKRYVKFYHVVKPEEIERDDCGRKWIDYDEQINSYGYISDEHKQFGIWATSPSIFYEAIGCTKRYGDSIMILMPKSGIQYIESGKEIVGDEFDVLFHGKLDEKETWSNLALYLGNEIIFDRMSELAKREFVVAKNAYDEYRSKTGGEIDVAANSHKRKSFLGLLTRVLKFHRSDL